MEGKTSKLSAGGPPWKWACWDVRSPFGLVPLRNSANPATCSLEVVAKMPQHIAKCQRGQGVWQAVKSLLKLAHRLEVKLWRQRKLALHFCLTLGWQKLKRCCHQVRKLRPHSPLVWWEKKGATIDYLCYVLFSSRGGSRQNWKCDPTTVARSTEKVTNCWHKTVGAKCWMMHESGWDAQSSGNTSQQFKTVVAETSSDWKNKPEEQIYLTFNCTNTLWWGENRTHKVRLEGAANARDNF